MAEKPAFLKGRGRGRGKSQKQSTPGQLSKSSFDLQSQNGIRQEKPGFRQNGSQSADKVGKLQEKAEQRFEESRQKFQEAAKKYLDDDDLDLSEDEGEDVSDDILNKIFLSYSQDLKGEDHNGVDMDKAQGDLLHSYRSGTSACLICIESIKAEDPIWNCEGCYGMFHIQCVQRWVKEGVHLQVYQNEEPINDKQLPWHCPKCRYEYKQSECPTRYMCFCRKTRDPKFDPWLFAHSCGERCGRKLKPECGHECLLLCHPGGCPPCPQTVKVACFCGKSPPQTRRCINRTWACGKTCGHVLLCGQHRCEQACHAGECGTCPKSSSQRCQCGKEVQNRPCASPSWQCKKVCSKRLTCGNHTCEEVCHLGKCGSCPRAGQRSCPCGKTTFELPCTEDVPTCVDTCGKILDCGNHFCHQRCHNGPCGPCREMTVKKCRCGQRQKEVQCCKEFLCETKCSKQKDCHRHQCKRKCCEGNCPICEQQCNKALRCRNHKCASRCHRGPCYPCTNTVEISCFCKSTSITVPCGREKNTKPPRCNKICRTPPDCHHEARAKHRCHFGDCPPCRWICDKSLAGCSHMCPAVCHSAVKTKVQEKVIRAGPWEPQPKARLEIVDRPCPPCMVPVTLSCLGKHEEGKFPCSEVRPWSCHRVCGRQLTCGNHICNIECHQVNNAPNSTQSGSNCEQCENQCVAPRPHGCKHDCLLPCHPGACPHCKQMIKMRCHCGTTVQHVECYKWNKASQETKSQLQSCGGECPRPLSCGHPCGAVCHTGPCSDPTQCIKKVNVRCPCRRKKKDFQCKTVQAGLAEVLCDDVCEKETKKKKKAAEEAEKEKKEAELKKQQAELEEYERKIKGKKKKFVKQKEEIIEISFWQRNKTTFVIVGLLAVVLGFAFYLIQTPS